MGNKVKYLDVLSGAIAQVEQDSFEAREVVYDRLWKVVLRQLQQEGRESEEDLAAERTAFLAAVSRIEFGKRPEAPATGAGGAAGAPGAALRAMQAPKRAVSSRIAVRMAVACSVLAAIWFAYLVIMVRFDSASAERWIGESVAADKGCVEHLAVGRRRKENLRHRICPSRTPSRRSRNTAEVFRRLI